MTKMRTILLETSLEEFTAFEIQRKHMTPVMAVMKRMHTKLKHRSVYFRSFSLRHRDFSDICSLILLLQISQGIS